MKLHRCPGWFLVVSIFFSLLMPGCLHSARDSTVETFSYTKDVDSRLDLAMNSDIEALSEQLLGDDVAKAALNGDSDLPSSGNQGTSFGLANSAPKWDAKVLVKRLQTIWKSSGKSVCTILKPFIKGGGSGLNHPYFFMGASAQAGSVVQAVYGRDFVWDLYNLQFASFTYKGPELIFGSGMIGSASANAYLGLGFGVRPDVKAAWSGVFVGGGVSGSLPILADYLSGQLNGFAAGTNDGKPDLSFVGASAAISAGLSVPTGAPGAVSVSRGFWTVDKTMNQSVSRVWKSAKIALSMEGRDSCEGDCIRFDTRDQKASYRGRAMSLATSIAAFVTPKLNEGFDGLEPVMLLALATGAYRDALNTGQACIK